jgi:undecaprenyl-diphosphatase
MNQVMKYTFERPRPSVVEWVTQVSSPSFPSGHAMGSLVVFASLALVITRLTRTKGLRAFTWALAALLVAAVGASRLYLGVHYPSDVIAGYLAGTGWLGVVVLGERGVGGVRRARRARHGARDEGEPSPPRREQRAPAPEDRPETHETH